MIGPEDVEPHVDEHTIGVAAVVGTTFTGHADDVTGDQRPARCGSRRSAGSTSRCTSTGRAAASSGRSCTRTPKWDFRLEQVRSINVSGHKFGLVFPGIGWLIFRERARPARRPRLHRELPRQDRRDVHAELLDRLGDGAGPVLPVRAPRPRGLPLRHGDDAGERADARRADRRRRLLRAHRRRAQEQLPLVAFKLTGERDYDEFDVASQLAAERGWMVPAYTLPPNAQDETIMRALVKLTLGQHARGEARRRHHLGVPDARPQGRPAPARPQAREDRRRLLTRFIRRG